MAPLGAKAPTKGKHGVGPADHSYVLR